MKKRIPPLALALSLVLTLMPSLAAPIIAAEVETVEFTMHQDSGGATIDENGEPYNEYTVRSEYVFTLTNVSGVYTDEQMGFVEITVQEPSVLTLESVTVTINGDTSHLPRAEMNINLDDWVGITKGTVVTFARPGYYGLSADIIVDDTLYMNVHITVLGENDEGTNTVTPPAPPNRATASTWAQNAVADAVARGFVPAELQTNYKNVITRAEFCRMTVKWLEYFASESVDGLLDTFGLSRDPSAFTDTNDPDILAAHALGITKGTGNGQFTLNSQFTREEAATMIMNVCKLFSHLYTDETAPAYADIGDASPWAVEGINFCRANGIMIGVGDNRFNPKATFTIEQSIQTFSNMR